LKALVEEAMARQESAAQERGVCMALAPSAMRHELMVARGPASLVLANLLDNAVKFSPVGGRVTVQLATEGAEARVSVGDEGPGIQKQDLPYVFERFYRGAAARAGAVPGIGLGLALSHAIVKAHGGRIEASSPVAGGALFTVSLPFADAAVTARP
jgi:two-component system OmpR family sensor kinase